MNKGPDNPELERRRGLTFAQAEGLAPLPQQLKREELPGELRREISDLFYKWLEDQADRHTGWLSETAIGPFLLAWRSLFKGDRSSLRRFRVDFWRIIKVVFSADWEQFYGFLGYVLRADGCPVSLKKEMGEILERHLAAYRVIEDTLVPVASVADADAFKKNLATLREADEESVVQHFKEAAMELGQGKYNKSVHSSAMGLEKAVQNKNENESVKSGVDRLRREGKIHPALAESIKKVYAFAGDALDVRHPGDERKKAPVTEDTALFVFSACAASASYIINLT